MGHEGLVGHGDHGDHVGHGGQEDLGGPLLMALGTGVGDGLPEEEEEEEHETCEVGDEAHPYP